MGSEAPGAWSLASTPDDGVNEYTWEQNTEDGVVILDATGPGLHQGDGWWVHGQFVEEGKHGGRSHKSRQDFFVADGVDKRFALKRADQFMREHPRLGSITDVHKMFKGSGAGYNVEAGGATGHGPQRREERDGLGDLGLF